MHLYQCLAVHVSAALIAREVASAKLCQELDAALSVLQPTDGDGPNANGGDRAAGEGSCSRVPWRGRLAGTAKACTHGHCL